MRSPSLLSSERDRMTAYFLCISDKIISAAYLFQWYTKNTSVYDNF
ncbi:MAG: hypothetical protein V7K57_21420 [Nostoc sp.]